MIRKLLVLTALVAGLLTTALSAPSLSDITGSAAFSAVGTVADATAPIDPSPLEGENQAFVLNPVDASRTSQTALDYVAADGSLKIHVTPTTSYYLQDGNGIYRRSDYANVVVETAEVRAAGRRFTSDDGTARFIARAVFRPANDPPPPGQSPDCGSTLTLKNHAFNVKTTIVSTRAKVPCTGFGGFSGGFTVENFHETPRFSVAEGIEAYGGRLEIYVTPATKYFHGGTVSDWSRVVRHGNEVRVLGRFQHAAGAWVFVAKTVFTPSPAVPDTLNPYTDVEAVRTGVADDGKTFHYEGPSNGPVFPAPGGRFFADLVWTPKVTGGFTVAGSWVLWDGGPNILRGTLDGETGGTNELGLILSMDVTSGEGFFHGATGTGDMEGEVSPALPGDVPPALAGSIRLSVTKG